MDELSNLLAQPLARLGATTVTLGHGLAAGAALVLILLAMLGIGLWRSSRGFLLQTERLPEPPSSVAGLLSIPSKRGGEVREEWQSPPRRWRAARGTRC